MASEARHVRENAGPADPRALLRGIIAGLFNGAGRFYLAHGQLFGALSIVVLVAAVAGLGWLRPPHAWDMIAYLGAAWREAIPDPAILQDRVYEAVRAAVSPEHYAVLAEGDAYRLRQSTDPAAFQSMLGMYAVKWLYVKLIALIAPLAGPAAAAQLINTVAAAGFAGTLLWWLARERLLELAPAVVAMLLVAGFPALAMAETPDYLAAALVLAAFMAYDRGHGIAGAILLAIAVLARPDQVATAGVLMAFLWLSGDGMQRHAAAGFALAVGAYVLATHGSGHPGWWPHLWFSTYRIQESMEFFDPPFSLTVYLTAFAWNLVRAATENAWLGIYLGVAVLWALLHAGGLPFDRRRQALLGAALAAIAAKFVLFPLHDGRTVFPLLFPAMLIALSAAREAARKRT